MTDCDRIRADAAGLAAVHPGDVERDQAWIHACECSGCARALREAERLHALVRDAALSFPLDDAPARAPPAIVLELRREAGRRMLASAIAVSGAFALAVGFGRYRSPSRQDWSLALTLATTAAALATAFRRWAVIVIATAPFAAIGVAVATGTLGPVHASRGVECIATEITCSVAVVTAAWLAMRRGTTSLAPSAAAAGAAAGALGGAAALEVTCPAHTALPHLFAFHVAGVLLAAIAAAAISRRSSRA